MNGEDAMPFKKTLAMAAVRLRAAHPPEPERCDRAMRHRIVRRQYSDAGYRPRLSDPAITERAQPRGAGGAIDPLLEGQRSGDGKPGSIIKRAPVNAGHNGVGAVASSAGSRSMRDSALQDAEDPDAERRTEPFVSVQPDEIAVEVRQREVELLPAVRSVDDDVDPTRAPSRRSRGPG